MEYGTRTRLTKITFRAEAFQKNHHHNFPFAEEYKK